jgi:hypothetical protein
VENDDCALSNEVQNMSLLMDYQEDQKLTIFSLLDGKPFHTQGMQPASNPNMEFLSIHLVWLRVAAIRRICRFRLSFAISLRFLCERRGKRT